MKQYYAVFGDPIEHSLSPIIHSTFAAEFAIDLTYAKVAVAPELLANRVKGFFARGGSGLNITLPHKVAAFDLARSCGLAAGLSRTANTLFMQNGVLHAENTDGIGLLRDLRDNLNCPIAGQDILILGAGGVVRGILPTLLESKPASIHVVNRSPKRLEELRRFCADRLDSDGKMQFHLWRKYLWRCQSYGLILNAISVSYAQGKEQLAVYPEEIIGERSVAYDINYALGATPFVEWAREHKAFSAHDGLGMLVEQAAESFYYWHKVRPQTKGVVKRLRSRLGEEN